MAEKRMFTGKITESDAFLDMPLSSQCLYFHLCMYADDEGFVKNPKRIQRMIGANDDDMRVLISKNFVIIYENGVIVIKHWKMHNCIRKDRLHETEYHEEKAMLYVKESGAYTLDPSQGVPLLSTICQPNDNQMMDRCRTDDGQMSGKRHTEIRLDKISIDKNSIGKDSIDKDISPLNPPKGEKGISKKSVYFEDEELNNAFLDFLDMRKKIKKPATDRAIKMAINKLENLSGGDKEKKIDIINQSIMNCWQDLFPLRTERKVNDVDWSKV